MVIEYIGETIRLQIAELREKRYQAQNRGIYMFRLDEERVIDATLKGGLARYINHSCYPNCVAEAVEVDRDVKIIIFANRRIARGEEVCSLVYATECPNNTRGGERGPRKPLSSFRYWNLILACNIASPLSSSIHS